MPVYNIVLSTAADMAQPYGNLIKPISNSNLANVTWLVNWEGLFGQDLLRYKKCVMRYSLISESNTTLSGTANLGYLSVTGISTNKQIANIPGTFLGIIFPQGAIGTGNYRFNIGNLTEYEGIEVNMPSSISELGVRFYVDSENTLQVNIPHYVLQLQFHLSNDIEK